MLGLGGAAKKKLLQKITKSNDEMKKHKRVPHRKIRYTNLDSKNAVEEDMSEKSILFDNKNYDPVAFLVTVHAKRTYDELRVGRSTLVQDLKSQEIRLRELVREHYSSFTLCSEGVKQCRFVGRVWLSHLI